MDTHVICVFGSGDALDPKNHVYRARLQKALVNASDDSLIAIFGCHQPSMLGTNRSEADTGKAYLMGLALAQGRASCFATGRNIRVHDAPHIKSTAATCYAIADIYLRQGDYVQLVINWPYMWRARYLLRRQCFQAAIPWNIAKTRIIPPLACGGTFLPYAKDYGYAKAARNWLWGVLAREVGSWLNIFTTRYFGVDLNARRTARGI